MTTMSNVVYAMEAALAAHQDKNNPFLREGEDTFMRYDELRIIPKRSGFVDVEFIWRGELISTMCVGFDFAPSKMLTLEGIDGRVKVGETYLKVT